MLKRKNPSHYNNTKIKWISQITSCGGGGAKSLPLALGIPNGNPQPPHFSSCLRALATGGHPTLLSELRSSLGPQEEKIHPKVNHINKRSSLWWIELKTEFHKESCKYCSIWPSACCSKPLHQQSASFFHSNALIHPWIILLSPDWHPQPPGFPGSPSQHP